MRGLSDKPTSIEGFPFSDLAQVDVCFSACVPCHGIPPCKLFRCPGWMVHRMDQLETVATTSAECCEASPPYVKDRL